jgi:hypothetical protein
MLALPLALAFGFIYQKRAYEERIHVSEKASIALVMVRPAISRGTGLPGSVRPFTVTVASRHPTKRLGM